MRDWIAEAAEEIDELFLGDMAEVIREVIRRRYIDDLKVRRRGAVAADDEDLARLLEREIRAQGGSLS